MNRKEFYIGEEQEQFLKNLSDLSVSEHIRRAIDEYIERRTTPKVLTSSSVKIRILGEEIDA